MPKSKARKSHKKKVAARNVAVTNEKSRAQKVQKEFIMNLIKKEQEQGAFDNVQSGPISGSLLSGPLSFDGDLLTFDGTLDGPVVDINVDEITVHPEDKQNNEGGAQVV